MRRILIAFSLTIPLSLGAPSLSAQSPATYRITHTYTVGGDGSRDHVVPDPAQHRLFIGRQNRVMVVDENSGTLLGEVTGINGAHGVALAEHTGHGFATSGNDSSVVMFDLKTFKVLGRAHAAKDADAIIYDRISDRVFTFNGDAHSSTVIDPATGKLITNMRSLFLASLLAPAVALGQPKESPSKEYLYVGNTLGGDISVIEIPAHRVVGTIPATVVGNNPDDVISTRKGDVLYISRLDTRDVIALSTTTEKVLWRVELTGTPNHLALSANEQFLYVPVYDKGQLAIIDTKTHAVVKRLDVGKGAHGTILGPSGKYVYVGMMEANQVAVIDVASNSVKTIIPLPDGVRPFQVSRDEKTLYAQLSRLHGFVVVDLVRNKVIRTVAMPIIGKAPVASATLSSWVVNHGMGITPDNKYLMANGSLSDFTAIYALPSLDLVGTVPVGKTPNWVVFSKDGRFAYVSNRGENTISVISVADRKEVTRIKVGEFPQRMTVAMASRPH